MNRFKVGKKVYFDPRDFPHLIPITKKLSLLLSGKPTTLIITKIDRVNKTITVSSSKTP